MKPTLSLFSPQKQQLAYNSQQQQQEQYYLDATFSSQTEFINAQKQQNISHICFSSNNLNPRQMLPKTSSFAPIRISKQKTQEEHQLIPNTNASPNQTTLSEDFHQKNPGFLLDNSIQTNNFIQDQPPFSSPNLTAVTTPADLIYYNQSHLRGNSTKQWRDNSLSYQSKKLFEIGNGGIVLPGLSYKNSKFRDNNSQDSSGMQLLDAKLMNSVQNIRSLSEKSRKCIKKQLLPIQFNPDNGTSCHSVLDFFKKITKMKQKQLKKYQLQKREEYEEEERSNAYQIYPNGIQSQLIKLVNSNQLNSNVLQDNYGNVLDIDDNNQSDDDDDQSETDSAQADEDELGNRIRMNKMNVKFSTRRRAVDPGTVEQLIASSKETFVQPKFMQERGSMCITELWPESMKLDLVRSHYQSNKKHEEMQLRKITPLLAHQLDSKNTSQVQSPQAHPNNCNASWKSQLKNSFSLEKNGGLQYFQSPQNQKHLPAAPSSFHFAQLQKQQQQLSAALAEEEIDQAHQHKNSINLQGSTCRDSYYQQQQNDAVFKGDVKVVQRLNQYKGQQLQQPIVGKIKNTQLFRERAITEMSPRRDIITQVLSRQQFKQQQQQKKMLLEQQQVTDGSGLIKKANGRNLNNIQKIQQPELTNTGNQRQNNNSTSPRAARLSERNLQKKILFKKPKNDGAITVSAAAILTCRKLENIKSQCEYALAKNQRLEETIKNNMQDVNVQLNKILLKLK